MENIIVSDGPPPPSVQPTEEEEFFPTLMVFPEPFFIGPVSEWDCEIVTLLCPLETWTSTFTVCGVLLTSS
jgi:hypothetical protein